MSVDTDKEAAKMLPLLLHGFQKVTLTARHRRIGLAFMVSCLICCGLLAGLMVTAALLRFPLLSMRQGSQEPIFTTMAVNGSGVQLCQGPAVLSPPCMANDNVMVTKDGSSLGPLYFTSDSAPSGTNPSSASYCANCPRFQLTTDKLGVAIPVAGVYKVFSQIVFHDKVDAYVSAAIQIHPIEWQQLCKLGRVSSCSEDRKNGSFKWLSCLTHHHKSNGPDLTQCTIDGVRRFHAGDVISFAVGQDFRTVRVDPTATHFYIYKL